MKHFSSYFHFLRLILILVFPCKNNAATDIPVLTSLPGNGNYELSWHSTPGRIYLMQVSLNLVTWTNCPMVVLGDGNFLSWPISTTGIDRHYVRLRYSMRTHHTQGDAGDADGDGFSNLSEVQTYGTDPFLWDTDGDVLSDSQEVAWNASSAINGDSDLDGIDDSREDFDYDGLLNYQELALISPVLSGLLSPYAPEQILQGTRPALRFRCLPRIKNGFFYQAQTSPNLLTWTDINHYTNDTGPVPPAGTYGSADSELVPDGTGAHRFTVQAPTDGFQFLRLKISPPFPGYELRRPNPLTLADIKDFKAHNDAHFTQLVPDNNFNTHIFDQYDVNGTATFARWCWTNRIDLSGVAWDNIDGNGNSACEWTLISPQHVITATHFLFMRGLSDVDNHPILTANSPVVFHDRDGNRVFRHVVSYGSDDTDITVGRLDAPVPPGVKYYKVLPPGSNSDWHDRLDHARTVNTVRERLCYLYKVESIYFHEGIPADVIQFEILPSVSASYRIPFRGEGCPADLFCPGDSANPQFVFFQGEPVLLTCASYSNGGVFYSSIRNFNKINQLMLETGGSAQLETINLK